MRYTTCICIWIHLQWSYGLFLSLLVRLLGLSLSRRIHLLNRFCCQRRSLVRCQHFLEVLDTTKYQNSYFFPGIDERWWLYDGENDEKNIAIGVCKWSESIILFLACRVPESEVDHSIIDLYCCGIVVEHRWDVLCGEFILSVTGWGQYYLISRHVLPTEPSPTTTSFTATGY